MLNFVIFPGGWETGKEPNSLYDTLNWPEINRIFLVFLIL